jgi:hypothetical protein
LRPDYRYVITPGGEYLQRADGLQICSLEYFLGNVLPAMEEA